MNNILREYFVERVMRGIGERFDGAGGGVVVGFVGRGSEALG